MPDNRWTENGSWALYLTYQYLLEQSSESLYHWNMCDEFVEANAHIIGYLPPNLFKNALIDITIDAAGNVNSASNIGRISEMRYERLVSTVIVSIPINDGPVEGCRLFRRILPEIKRQCGDKEVHYRPPMENFHHLTSEAAAIIEVILLTFANAKNIIFEITPRLRSAWAFRNGMFSYKVIALGYASNANGSLITPYVSACQIVPTSAYSNLGGFGRLGVSNLNRLCERDCSYETVNTSRSERRIPSNSREYYRYLIYYPTVGVRRWGRMVLLGMFQVIP